MRFKSVLMILMSGLSGFATQAQAQAEFKITDAEIARLPIFCAARYKGSATEYKLWVQRLGRDFAHTHHYCNGLNYINRYYSSRSQQDKRFNLNNAEGNLQYMVAHADPGYTLMPDVYLNLGVVHLLLKQPAQALTHFNKAIELNPRQPKAYNALSDYYAKTKQSAKALEIVTTGLRYNPDTKSLQRRYTELGGKLPYPAPIEPTLAVEAEAAKPEEPPTPTPGSVEPAASPTTVPPAPVETIAEPQIGSPTNPYCRFCPD
jgi:tetratricopeptide (TPR) repeat protein